MRKIRLDPYPAQVLATCRRHRLLAAGDRVLVALSGGPDSTALLAALAALRDAGALTSLVAVHVDHGLRSDIAADIACARETCDRLGVPLSCVRVVVGPGNVQAEARRARYAAFRAEAARLDATRIATGHTRTDQAETVLLRLLRGAGARGLAAIPFRRGTIIRPLLDLGREEGLAWLRRCGIAWRDDPTNATPRYARNRVRLELVPVLRGLAPAFERALARTAGLAREDERALARRASEAVGEATTITLAALRREPVAVRHRMVRALHRNAGGAATLEAGHVAAVLALARRRRPGRATLPGGLVAVQRYGRLEVVAAGALRPPGPPDDAVPLPVPGPGRFHLPGGEGWVEVAAERAGDVPWPLELRRRRPGDRFRPDGGRGSKTLKRWLIDRKVPREARDGLWLLAAGTRVVAIPALGAVERGFGPSGAGLEVVFWTRS